MKPKQSPPAPKDHLSHNGLLENERKRANYLFYYFSFLMFVAISSYLVLHHFIRLDNNLVIIPRDYQKIARQLGKAQTLLETNIASTEVMIYDEQQILTLRTIADDLKNQLITMNLTNADIDSILVTLTIELSHDRVNKRATFLLFDQLEQGIRFKPAMYFWDTSFWRWIELAYWSLFGVILYIMTEIYTYYPYGAYIEKTPWYFVTAIRGPIISLLISFFLTSVEAGISGIEIGFNKARIELLIFIAAVLGFFSRVAREQLNILVEKVFTEAWARSGVSQSGKNDFNIMVPKNVVKPGEQIGLTVTPSVEVRWFILPSNKGEISLFSGEYTAPTAEQFHNFEDDKVTIVAQRKSDDVTRSITIEISE